MSTLTTHTSATRATPSSSNIGLCKFNTTTKAIEVSDGSNWLGYENDGLAPAYPNTYSLQFDGTDDIMTASGAALDLKSNFSVSGWFRPSAISPGGFGWYWGESTGGKRRAFLIINGQWNFNDGLVNVLSTTISQANVWYHVVVTLNSSYTEAKIYVNGSLENTADWSASTQSFTYSNTQIGDSNLGNGFPGVIDELAIFNSVLSASDVAAIYNKGKPYDLSSYSPVGWWRMGDNDNGSGTTITDQGSGGNNGTLANGPVFTNTVPS
jgi:hypothetical protein